MNLMIATGNLGRDCRVGRAGDSPVCNFSIAVKSGYGEREQTLWLDCAMFGKRASGKLPGYLVKGQQVAVSGELGTREHEGKTYLTLRVADLDLIGGRADKDSPAVDQQSRTTAKPEPFDDDSDIPF
mgnify:CR=1 FL=1